MRRVYNKGLSKKENSYCYECKEIKPKSEFYSDKSRSSGVMSRCKKCEKKRGKTRHEYFRDYAEAKKEKSKNISINKSKIVEKTLS